MTGYAIAMQAPVPDAVTLAQTAPLELCCLPVQRRGFVSMHVALSQREFRGAGDQLVDVLRVIFPVGRNVHGAAGCELAGGQLQKRSLYQAALVMPFLGPGIGKIQIDTSECVVLDNPQIRQSAIAGGDQAMADARLVDLNAEKIDIRLRGGFLHQGLAVAKADFQDPVSRASEYLIQVQ
jgi:hypothetical protein